MTHGGVMKKICITPEHVKDSFEAINCNTSKVRSERRNTIAQPTTQAKYIVLSWTAHTQFRALNLRHDSDMHYWSGANPSKKRESRALVAAIQPIPKRYRVLQHWWGNRSEKALADDQRRLLEELTGTDGVIDGKLQGILFPIWRVRQHMAENLLLQYAQVGWPVLVGRDWNIYEMETAVTKVPHSSALEDDAI